MEKTAKLERQILFFSWLGIIVGLISNRSMAKRELLSMLFPTVGKIYWFATAYMILYFLSPWYNKLLMSLDKKEYQKLLLTMTVIWRVIPCLTLRTYDGMNVNQQIWMFVMYAYGGYIYRFNWKIKNSKGLLCIGIVWYGIFDRNICKKISWYSGNGNLFWVEQYRACGSDIITIV